MHKEEFNNWCKNIEPFYIPEINRNKEGILENKLIKKFGFLDNILEIYNHWVDNILDLEIKAKNIKTQTGVIYFSFNSLEKPKILINNKKMPLYPKMARDKGISYTGELFLNAKFVPFDKDQSIYETKFFFGKIPVLLGSKYCNLHGLTIDELIEKGECPNDTFGYNIIKGTERVIVTQDKLRESQYFSFLNSSQESKIESRITCTSPIGTSVVIMNIGKQWNTLKVKLNHTKGKKHIPLFILFLFLGININDAVDMILVYIPEKNRELAEISLSASIAKTDAHKTDPIGYWRIKRKLYSYLSNKEALDLIINDINKDLFSNIPVENNSEENYNLYIKELKEYRKNNNIKDNFIPFQVPQIEKAKQLALMSARMLETINNNRVFDNRDNWSNKRLETSGRSYEFLFVTMYDVFITCKETLEISKIKNLDPSLMISRLSGFHGKITEYSEICFNSNSWGIKGSIRKENITNLITRESPLSVISQLKKVNTPTSRKAKSEGIRALQGSQSGILCITETPEGSNCGLVKAQSITSCISIQRPLDDIYNYLKSSDLFFKEFQDNTYSFLINGIIVGWCYKSIVDKIIELRRQQKLPVDIAILFNKNDKSVEYYCDSARPCMPLLIVEDKELLIDKKNLWNESIDNLFKHGVIEIIDIKELEHRECIIAVEPKNVLNRNKIISDLLKNKNKLEKIRRNNENGNLIDNKKYNYYLSYILKLKDKNTINNVILALESFKFNRQSNILIFKDIIQNIEIDNKKNIIIGINFIIKYFKDNIDILDDLQVIYNLYDDLYDEFKTDLELNAFKNKKPYTHSEIHPINMFSISSGLIPLANCNQAARLTYQASMGKQASGHYHYNHHLRFESFKMLNKPTRPFLESEISEPVGFNVMPSGQQLTIAIYADPFNMEDSIIGHKEFFENENFENIKWICFKTSRKQISGYREEFKKPNITYGENKDRYRAIDDYGIPIVGEYVKEGDCVIGKVRYIEQTEDSSKKEENASIFMGVKEEGYIEKVLITDTGDSNTLVIKVMVGKLRIQQVGDKLSSRYSQKGTFGEMRPSRDMIRVASGPNKGVIPNIIVNTNGQFGRMTMGMIKEILLSKAGLYGFERVNGTTFNELDMEHFHKILENNGLDKFGNETMCSPDGKILKYPIYFGACFYQSLRHHVDDKIQIRSRGKIRPISHQPVKGRSKKGGLKLGEMERDGLIASGGSSILNERLMIVSDKYKTVFCSNCGNIAISDIRSEKYNKNTCSFCNKNAEFGLLTIPYIYKLIYNMLLGVNINIKHGLKYKIEQGGSLLEKYLS